MSKPFRLSIALLALCAFSSTCTGPGTHVQAQVLVDGETQEELASDADEWRLDGTIEKADARASAIWLAPDVLVLRDDNADLGQSFRARRIEVDAATQVWTPDGQARPFGFNALTSAMRLGREVSIVGFYEGNILRARLVILPDLLPAGWRPQPFGAALRSRATRKPTSKAPSVRAPIAKAPIAKAPIAKTPRVATERTPKTRAGSLANQTPVAPAERAPVARAPREKQPRGEEVQTKIAAATPAVKKADRVAARPSISAPARATRASRGARTDAHVEERAPSARSGLPDLLLRASRPPLLRPPSPPQVAVAPEVSDTLAAHVPQAIADAIVSEPNFSLSARDPASAPNASPRDVRREVERQRIESLRASAPRASSAPLASSWSTPSPSARAGFDAPRIDAPREMQEMRAPTFTLEGRVVVRPPQISSPAPESSSRLAQSLAPLRRAPALSPGAPQVLGESQDAMQVLAASERLFLAARAQFAPLRAMQDEIAWPDFSGGPGWDGALDSAARTATRTVATEVQSEVESRKMIALSFDDGPHPNTRRVLDILDSFGAKATFFVVGRNIRRHADILREVARRGHDIGNHSDQHVQGVRLDARAWQREVDACNRAIEEAIGIAPRWFRAPGCRYSMEALAAISSRNMVRVDSSNNSGDWHEPSPERIAERVLSRLAPGQVLLFHDPLPQTVRALPILLRELRARGYKCVTLSELARASAQTPGFVPPPRPPGQGIVLPAGFERLRARAPQALKSSEPLSSDAPVLLQMQP